MYFCIRLAASQQLKQASLRSICTIFAFEFIFLKKNFGCTRHNIQISLMILLSFARNLNV